MSLKKDVLRRIYDKGNGKCWYCGIDLIFERKWGVIDSTTFATDHLMPVSAGGKDDEDNLVPCCWGCNSSKKNKTLEEFRNHCTRMKNGVPLFSEIQLEYLRKCGFSFPVYKKVMFYFEMKSMEA